MQRMVLGFWEWDTWNLLVRVTAAQRAEAPVSLYSGKGRVVCVVGRIDRPAGIVGDGTSEKHGEDAVVDGVGLGLIEGEEDQSPVVVEVSIVEQGEEPIFDPAGGKVDGGVVAVVDHVGRHEHPLRQSGGVDIDGKVIEVADICSAGGVRGNRIVDYERVVLAYPESVISCRGVEVVDGREATLFQHEQDR